MVEPVPHELTPEGLVAAFHLAFGAHPGYAEAEPHVRELAANPAVMGFLRGLLARLGTVLKDPRAVSGLLGLLALIPGVGPVVTPLLPVITALLTPPPAPAPAPVAAEPLP